MLKRLKQAIVESFVGAIALGWLLAQAILRFVGIFTSPVAGWITRSQYRQFTQASLSSTAGGFSFKEALPDAIIFTVLLLVWYILLRWLYFKPVQKQTTPQGQSG